MLGFQGEKCSFRNFSNILIIPDHNIMSVIVEKKPHLNQDTMVIR